MKVRGKGIRAYHKRLIVSPSPTFTARLTCLSQAVPLDSASQALTRICPFWNSLTGSHMV